MIIQVFGFSRLSGTDHLEGEGLVIYIRIEGGFYGIVAGPNGQWDPMNLPAEYMKDGLKVKFEGKKKRPQQPAYVGSHGRADVHP